MKKWIFTSIIISSFFISCKNLHTFNQLTEYSIDNCPENSQCKLEFIPNKSLVFKTDEFGHLYPEISEGSKTLLKYTFKKNPLKNVADSNYSELIYAELDSTITKTSLKNKSLKSIKLHFARLCFCKGTSGYFPVKKGEFKLKKASKDSIKISINFTISEIPQIISTINETISIK